MSKLKTPQFMRDINIFVSGLGHLGVSDEFELPKVLFNRETKNAGGFEQEIKDGTFQKMECKLIIEKYSKAMIAALGDGSNASFVIKGSISENGRDISAVATIKGDFDVDFGKWKAKEAIKQTLDIKVKFFELEVDGIQYCQIDVKNMIAIINGKDHLSELRANIQ